MIQSSAAIRSRGGAHNVFVGNKAYGYDTVLELENERHAVALRNEAIRGLRDAPRSYFRTTAAAIVLAAVGGLVSDAVWHWLPLL